MIAYRKLTPKERARALSLLHKYMLLKTGALIRVFRELDLKPDDLELARQYWKPSDYKLLLRLSNDQIQYIAWRLKRYFDRPDSFSLILDIGACPFCLALQQKGRRITQRSCREENCPYGLEKGFCHNKKSVYRRIVSVLLYSGYERNRKAKKLLHPDNFPELKFYVELLNDELGMSNRQTLPGQTRRSSK